MQELPWLGHLPGNNLQGGVDLANRLYWNVTWHEHEGHWFVYGGEALIYRTDLREAAEAFLYGLGLAYAVLPEESFEHLEYCVKRWAAPEDITQEERVRYGDH